MCLLQFFLLIRVKSWLDQPGRHDCELVRNNYLNIIIEPGSPNLYYQNPDSEFTGASSTVGLSGRGGGPCSPPKLSYNVLEHLQVELVQILQLICSHFQKFYKVWCLLQLNTVSLPSIVPPETKCLRSVNNQYSSGEMVQRMLILSEFSGLVIDRCSNCRIQGFLI